MANRFCNLIGANAIKDEYTKINTGFDSVQSEVDDMKSDINAITIDSGALIGFFCSDAVGVNTITTTYTGLTYFDNLKVILKTAGTNTSRTMTLDINGEGVKSIKVELPDGTKINPPIGCMPSQAVLKYDNTDFILLNPDPASWDSINLVKLGFDNSGATSIVSDLNDLLTDIGSAKRTIRLNEGIYLFDTDITIPDNITLRIDFGAILYRTNNANITLNCRIKAGVYHILDDDGTGNWLGSPIVDEIYPEWFGALGDLINDDTTSIETALSLLDDYMVIRFKNNYLIQNMVIPDKKIKLIFDGYLKATTGGDTNYLVATYKYVNNNAESGVPLIIENIEIDGNNIVDNGLVFQCWNSEIISPEIYNCNNHGLMFTTETRNGTAFTTSTLVNNKVIDPLLHNNTRDGLHVQDSSRNKATDYNIVRGYYYDNGDNGINLESCAGTVLDGCHTYGNTTRGILISIGSLAFRMRGIYCEESVSVEFNDFNTDIWCLLSNSTLRGNVRLYSNNTGCGLLGQGNVFEGTARYQQKFGNTKLISIGDEFDDATTPFEVTGSSYTPNPSAPNETIAIGSVSRAIGLDRILKGLITSNSMRTEEYGSTVPVGGNYERGDLVINNLPYAGGNIGWACVSGGNPGTWIKYGVIDLSASTIYDPPSLADGEGVTTTITVTGAEVGDQAMASFSNPDPGVFIHPQVTATDTVSVRFQNESGGVVDLDSGTLRVKVIKQ